MVQPFLPNTSDAYHANQAEPDTVDFEILLLAYQDTGVVSGCAVTESTPNAHTVDIASGTCLLGGAGISVSTQDDKSVTTADVTNPRIDLISINTSGTAVVTAGTAAAQPVAPAIPANSIPLAYLYVPANWGNFDDQMINDKRVILRRVYAREVAGNVTLDETYSIVNMESTGGARVVTMPAVADQNGHSFYIHRDGSNTVTINRAGSDTFEDGDTAKTLDTDGASIGLYSIGDTEWKIAGTRGTVGGS